MDTITARGPQVYREKEIFELAEKFELDQKVVREIYKECNESKFLPIFSLQKVTYKSSKTGEEYDRVLLNFTPRIILKYGPEKEVKPWSDPENKKLQEKVTETKPNFVDFSEEFIHPQDEETRQDQDLEMYKFTLYLEKQIRINKDGTAVFTDVDISVPKDEPCVTREMTGTVGLEQIDLYEKHLNFYIQEFKMSVHAECMLRYMSYHIAYHVLHRAFILSNLKKYFMEKPEHIIMFLPILPVGLDRVPQGVYLEEIVDRVVELNFGYHDSTKISQQERESYTTTFTRTNLGEKKTLPSESALTHHYSFNGHHFKHFEIIYKKKEDLLMPPHLQIEMVNDMGSAFQAQNNDPKTSIPEDNPIKPYYFTPLKKGPAENFEAVDMIIPLFVKYYSPMAKVRAMNLE